METKTTATSIYTEFIDRLPGVVSSSVVAGGDEIIELHILSDISRSPKQLVRDIQSLFMAQFHKELDHKVISIAQIDFDNVKAQVSRLTIEEICVSRKKESAEVSVALSIKGERATGCATCTTDKMDINRAISQATLNAAVSHRKNESSFKALDVRFSDLADSTVVLVCVSIKTTSGSCRFCGSALVGDDVETTVVKATLDAINRKIGL